MVHLLDTLRDLEMVDGDRRTVLTMLSEILSHLELSRACSREDGAFVTFYVVTVVVFSLKSETALLLADLRSSGLTRQSGHKSGP